MALLSTWAQLEPSYLAQLCIYTGAIHREEIMHLSILFLKLRIFFKNSHFALFGFFGIYAKDTKFINVTHTHHTHRDINVHRHMHTQIQKPFFHFTLFGSFGMQYMLKILISHLAHHTCIQIHTDTCTHTETDILFTFYTFWLI